MKDELVGASLLFKNVPIYLFPLTLCQIPSQE